MATRPQQGRMRSNYNRISNSVKVAVVTAIATIAVALIGAWQVAASAGTTGLTRGEVRQMIQNEAPVNSRGANQLFATLNRIDDNVTQLKVSQGIDHALLQQLIAGRK